MSKTLEEILGGPPISDEEKILFWMRMAKERGFMLERLRSMSQAALDAYEDRFESTTGKGNYMGPIDEEMKALREALEFLK